MLSSLLGRKIWINSRSYTQIIMTETKSVMFLLIIAISIPITHPRSGTLSLMVVLVIILYHRVHYCSSHCFILLFYFYLAGVKNKVDTFLWAYITFFVDDITFPTLHFDYRELIEVEMELFTALFEWFFFTHDTLSIFSELLSMIWSCDFLSQ